MKKGYLYILLATGLFGSIEIALKIVANEFNPIQMTFLRFLIGSIILFPSAVNGLRRRQCRLGTNDFIFFVLMGFLCVVVSMVLYQLALQYSQASVVAVLFSCNAVFVILLARLILHEKIYWRTIVSIIVSLLGIVVITDAQHNFDNRFGIMLVILSAIAFALYGVIGRKGTGRYGSAATTCFTFIFGCLEMYLLILITRIGPIAAFLTDVGLKSFAAVPILHGLSLQMLPSLVYIGVFNTGLGYTFYSLAQEATSTATASLVFFIKPALTPVLAFFIIGEPITARMAAGILLIIVGSLISFISIFRFKKNQD
jgi:drug/metabolite transporter (DMT)-like permease